MKPGIPFHWDDTLDNRFKESKDVIISEIEEGVRIFDKSKPTCLATDWSKHGISFWLFQKHCKCKSDEPFCCRTGWKITLVGSRFTHAAESRYAPIEGKALAVADALDKARFFVLGCTDLIIAVDHKPPAQDLRGPVPRRDLECPTTQSEGKDTPVQISHDTYPRGTTQSSGRPLKTPHWSSISGDVSATG